MYHPRATPALLTTLVVAALTLGITPPAAAHDGLIAASPEPGSTVTTELSQVTLDFSQDFLDLGGLTTAFAIQVSGPDGNFYNVGCVTVEPSRISVRAQLGESGQYTVVWQIVSSDGHPTSDTYQFNYNKPADTVAAAGSAIADTCKLHIQDKTSPGKPPLRQHVFQRSLVPWKAFVFQDASLQFTTVAIWGCGARRSTDFRVYGCVCMSPSHRMLQPPRLFTLANQDYRSVCEGCSRIIRIAPAIAAVTITMSATFPMNQLP